jgi:hypothetical protein
LDVSRYLTVGFLMLQETPSVTKWRRGMNEQEQVCRNEQYSSALFGLRIVVHLASIAQEFSKRRDPEGHVRGKAFWTALIARWDIDSQFAHLARAVHL